DHRLRTGDIVEMITSNHSYGPSQDWLKMTQSSHAKNKIRQWHKKQRRDENVEKGKELIEKELRNQGYDPKEILTEANIANVASKYNFSTEDEIYAAVGYNGITPKQVVTRLTEKARKLQNESTEAILKQFPDVASFSTKRKTDSGVRVKGVDNLMIRLSKCCNPVPGDEIVGYITKGRGVSIHRANCPNINQDEAERLLEVEWEGQEESKKQYNVDIEITGYDRNGLLNEVLQAVSETKTQINAVTGKADKNKVAIIHMTIAIPNVTNLVKVVERIKRLPDIYSVRRMLDH
ncbi:MAG TPA: ACT domain-containing protein, partial [Candidatus Angelobacter sp.]|nr:ACT domain-containing protein [Candidatus Angelobacter sp.]